MNNAQVVLTKEFENYLSTIQAQMLSGLISYSEMEAKQQKAQKEHSSLLMKMTSKECFLDKMSK